MKVIPLLAVAACALGLAACTGDRPHGYGGGYGYNDRVFIETDRGYGGYRRDRDRRDERGRRDDRRRDGGMRQVERRDDRGRDRDRARDGDGDRRRGDGRNDYR